ncbi:MAG TPA: ATP-binding protein [Bryobacteraceae bacterium]|nr:ATP-binding protein [Bryobacteraceae bacterium]
MSQPDPGEVANELALVRAKLDKLSAHLAEEHKMAELGRLLAGIVHEINSPIGSIVSNNQVIIRSLEMLKSALSVGDRAALEKAARQVETCLSLAAIDKIACERISEVVRGLKTFVRADSVELRKADLNQQIASTLKLTHGQFKGRITVETDFGELPPVECHASMLGQVFLNILVNAGQAIEGPGKITVRTRPDGGAVHISIADTGAGIKPEDRPRVFAGGFTTKPVGVGTGLGLSLSKRIVEETHGGSIDFESEVGVGTTFHIRIPVEQKKKAAG